MKHLLFNINWSHAWCYVLGPVWAFIEPTVPFALLCIFAVLIDCISAWRLSRRIRRKYGERAADGKLKSKHMTKIMGDLFMLFACMLIAQGVTDFTELIADVNLGNWIAAAFLLITLVSILENESSQNDSTWARSVQKVVMDKTERHLKIDLKELTKNDNNDNGNGNGNVNDDKKPTKKPAKKTTRKTTPKKKEQ